MTTPMEDLIYEIINAADMILEHLAAACFLYVLYSKLLSKKCLQNKKQRCLPAVFYFAVVTSLYVIPFVIPAFTAYFMGTAAAFLILVIVCRGDIYWSLFLTVTFFSLRWQAMSVTNRASGGLFHFTMKFLDWMTEGKFVSAWQWNMVHIGVNSLLNILLDVLIFTLFAKWFTARFSIQTRKLSVKEKLFLLSPGLSGAASFFLVQWIINKYDLVDEKGIFNEYPYFGGMIIGLNFLVILSTLVVLSLFADLERKREEEKLQAVQERQLQTLRGHVKEMEQVYSGIQGMRHDVKNHIAVMEELIAQKRFQEAKAYLEPMGHAVEMLDYVYKTANPVTDVIIQEKYKCAQALGISFESEFQFPVKSEIDVFDISVILNNALENALEAASKTEHGYVRVSSGWQKQMYLMEFCNSFDGKIEFESDSGLPRTTKSESALHGMGLKNIQRVAEKYYGAVDVEVKQNEFILTVLMSSV